MTGPDVPVPVESYRSAGLGTSFTRGRRPALLVVDLTRAFTENRFVGGADLTDVVLAAGQLVDVAHQAGVKVIFTSIAYSQAELAGAVTWLAKAGGMQPLLEGTDEVTLDPRLPQAEPDLHIVKKGASAFFSTNLAMYLTSTHCDTLVVCGASTSGCVRASVVDAVQYGFPVLVPDEAVGDRDKAAHDASMFDMQSKYADVVTLADAASYLSGSTPG